MHVAYWMLIFLLLFVYVGMAAATWPYSRRAAPLWILLFAVLVPPLFPILAVYTLWFLWLAEQQAALPPPIIVVERRVSRVGDPRFR